MTTSRGLAIASSPVLKSQAREPPLISGQKQLRCRKRNCTRGIVGPSPAADFFRSASLPTPGRSGAELGDASAARDCLCANPATEGGELFPIRTCPPRLGRLDIDESVTINGWYGSCLRCCAIPEHLPEGVS